MQYARGRTVLPKTELLKRDPRRIAEMRIGDLNRSAEKWKLIYLIVYQLKLF